MVVGLAWEDGVELNDTIRVCLLDATQEGGVYVGGIVCVAVSGGDDAGVDACTVAVPDIPVQTGDRFACFDVDKLAVKDDGDTRLPFSHVGANVFAFDPVLALN